MLRRIPRLLRRAFVVTVLLAVSASVYQSWQTGVPGAGGWVQTEFGPLGPADRNMLEKVRMAGLWEGPTSQQAQQQAISVEVREVAGQLAEEHAQLDEEVRDVANQLGVLLPSAPSAQQMGWIDEISRQVGSDYDRVYVQRLREAHGLVLPVIAEVRASTRNDLVREFATTAHEFVERHHELLESTGLVDYSALPHHSPGVLNGGTDLRDLVVPLLVFAAALLGAIALFWGLRNNGSPAPRRERVTLPQNTPRVPELATATAIPAPRPSDLEHTGPIPVIDDTVAAPTSGTGSRWAAAGTSDSGGHRFATRHNTRLTSDSGSHRAVGDSGSHRAVTDSGPHRPASTGSHRIPRSRARHSMRR